MQVLRLPTISVHMLSSGRIEPMSQCQDAGFEVEIPGYNAVEDFLSASGVELQALLAALTDVILVFDAEGRYRRSAPTSAVAHYKPPAHLIGKELHEIFPQAVASFFLKHIRRAVSEGYTHTVEYKLQIGEEEVWFAASVSPLPDNAVLWVARDISERKALEEQLRQAQKMELIGQLAGGIAHDFSNLLIAITIHNELALKELQADDPLRRNLEEIKIASDRATALTHQLLAFSRKQNVQPQVLNLNTVVAELKIMLRRLIGENIELHTVLAPNLGRIQADPGQIAQVIMNLALNARDAMPHGGTLTIETQNVYLDEHSATQQGAGNPGAHIRLIISDTGTGIEEQTKKRIFDPFFTTKEIGKGTGLGLTTVYAIVKQSGGTVWVHSEVGRGTAFFVELPCVDEGAYEDKQGTNPSGSYHGTETILLAEDEQIVRTLAREILEMYGYQVLEAANGGTALVLCERYKQPIHLLISDVVMPGLGGWELASRLAHYHPGIKVLFISGYMDAASLPQRSAEAELPFLQKPFSPDALARKVREVLDAGKMEQAEQPVGHSLL